MPKSKIDKRNIKVSGMKTAITLYLTILKPSNSCVKRCLGIVFLHRFAAVLTVEYGIFGEESDILTNQKRENSAVLILIG